MNLGSDKTVNHFIWHLMLAFMSAALIGFLFIRQIKAQFFNPISVALALIIGGFVILLVEKHQKNRATAVRR